MKIDIKEFLEYSIPNADLVLPMGKVREARRDYLGEHGTEPSVEWLAESLNLTKREVEACLRIITSPVDQWEP